MPRRKYPDMLAQESRIASQMYPERETRHVGRSYPKLIHLLHGV